MDKKEIYKYLDDNKIKYKINEHKAVFNIEELKDVELLYPTLDAKNLFVRDDKKQKYYLITIKNDKRVNLKEFSKENNTRPLSFASENDLLSLLGLIPGSVTPLGLLNDTNLKVEFFLDDFFLSDPCLIGCHPNENKTTIWLNTNDLIKIIKKHGNIVHVVKI